MAVPSFEFYRPRTLKSNRDYTVKKGDTLFELAQASLPPGATHKEVMDLVNIIVDSNFGQIPNKDMIRTGQNIRLPTDYGTYPRPAPKKIHGDMIDLPPSEPFPAPIGPFPMTPQASLSSTPEDSPFLSALGMGSQRAMDPMQQAAIERRAKEELIMGGLNLAGGAMAGHGVGMKASPPLPPEGGPTYKIPSDLGPDFSLRAAGKMPSPYMPPEGGMPLAPEGFPMEIPLEGPSIKLPGQTYAKEATRPMRKPLPRNGAQVLPPLAPPEESLIRPTQSFGPEDQVAYDVFEKTAPKGRVPTAFFEKKGTRTPENFGKRKSTKNVRRRK